MAIEKDARLSKCPSESNCFLVEWQIRDNIHDAFKEITNIASNLPRVKIINDDENYWHGVVRSLVFRFPDDLELLKIPTENKIQIRSASRIGISDIGVNRNRVNDIYEQFKIRSHK